ncbi:glycosyltransferase [Clostridium sp.]|uniref:glycosyltransferase n=1 Tax=Clostridium sp. TaxID=1506 RepID=UPI003D6D4E0E
MNNNKISFIIAVNDEATFRDCEFHINNLIVPNDFQIEIIPIRNAEYLTKAYNNAMNSCDSKYKVYLHQDVSIININFIDDILKVFSLDSIGVIGMCGTKTIPDNGIWWEGSELVGKVYESHTGKMALLKFNETESEYNEVDGVDGLIIITQYDIPWREDIFKGWHFYDLSQCMEFKKRGYKVVVPKQNTPWCTHDCGIVNTMNGFDENRLIYIKNYHKAVNLNELVDIYVISHKPYKMIESEMFTPIFTKREIVPNDYNILCSDEGDNISNENPLFAEFTTYYWVWKNRKIPKYVGFFQYRRYISFKDNVAGCNNFSEAINKYGWNKEELENLLEDCDVLLPTSLNFRMFGLGNMWNQYNRWHKSSYLNTALEIIKEKYPSYEVDCYAALFSNEVYYINLFIMTGDLFDSYMTWIMDIFEELKKRLNPEYNVKDFAYLGERLFNIFLVHQQRTKNIKIKIKQPVYIRENTTGIMDFWIGDETHIPEASE